MRQGRGDGGCEPSSLARYRLAPRRREITFGRLCDSAALASDRSKAIVAVGDVPRSRTRVAPRHEVVPSRSERRGPFAMARRAAVSSPTGVGRIRLYEPHKPGDRPAAADGTAEYDFRFRTEEKLAVGLWIRSCADRPFHHSGIGSARRPSSPWKHQPGTLAEVRLGGR